MVLTTIMATMGLTTTDLTTTAIITIQDTVEERLTTIRMQEEM